MAHGPSVQTLESRSVGWLRKDVWVVEYLILCLASRLGRS